MPPRPIRASSRTRKNMDMDADKLEKAQRVLGARSETETIDLALDYVLYQAEVFDSLDRLTAAGGLMDVFASATARRSRRRVAEP